MPPSLHETARSRSCSAKPTDSLGCCGQSQRLIQRLQVSRAHTEATQATPALKRGVACMQLGIPGTFGCIGRCRHFDALPLDAAKVDV